MTDKKVVFVAFAIEDERMRDLFKGQSLHPRHPYEFIDMSVKKPYDTEWKEKGLFPIEGVGPDFAVVGASVRG